MKKFTRNCLIFAGILMFLGIGISFAAAVMGATVYDLPSIDYNNSTWYLGENDWNLSSVWDKKNKMKESSPDESTWQEEVSQTLGDMKDLGFRAAFQGDERRTYGNVRKLDLMVYGSAARIIVADNITEIQVEISKNDGSYKVYLDDENELNIAVKWRKGGVIRGWGKKNPMVQITIPNNYQFDEVNLDIGAGVVYAEELNARKLDVQVEAGSGQIESGKVEEFNGECSAGELIYHGTVVREVEAHCMAGFLMMYLTGKESDYNYEIQISAGSMTVGNNNYAALGSVQRWGYQEAVGTMNLSSSAGAMGVYFQNE